MRFESDERVAKAEEKARARVEKATERAENVIAPEDHLTDRISGLHDLLQRLRQIWSDRSSAEA